MGYCAKLDLWWLDSPLSSLIKPTILQILHFFHSDWWLLEKQAVDTFYLNIFNFCLQHVILPFHLGTILQLSFEKSEVTII